MKNSNKKYRKLSESEIKERSGEDILKEMKSINEQIQSFQNSRQILIDDINKLPTLFQIALRSRREIRNSIKDSKDLLAESGIEFQAWQLPFNLRIFEDSNYKKTKNNLRNELKELKANSKKIQVEYEGFGQSYAQKVYSNPIIQNFFEFSLNYSLTKHIALTFEKAKSIFEKANRVSLGEPLETEKKTQSIKNFLAFISGEKSVLDSTTLPPYKVGRKKGSIAKDTKRIKELLKIGESNDKIVEILANEKQEKLTPAKRKTRVADVGRTARRLNFPAKKRQKIKK